MKRFFLLFLTISAGVGSVFANLGDGGDGIDDSYGNLIERHLRDDGTVTTLYHKGPYLYFVVFDNHVSVLEKYSRVDGAGLSEKEIAKFLKANAGRTVTWIRDETGASKERRFKRSDDKAEATYGKMDGRLTLTVRVVGREKKVISDPPSPSSFVTLRRDERLRRGKLVKSDQ